MYGAHVRLGPRWDTASWPWVRLRGFGHCPVGLRPFDDLLGHCAPNGRARLEVIAKLDLTCLWSSHSYAEGGTRAGPSAVSPQAYIRG